MCACVRVSRMYVRAYLAVPCVSANDNVKHTKSNIRYDNKKPRQNGRKMTSFRDATAKLGAGVDNELGGLAPHQCR